MISHKWLDKVFTEAMKTTTQQTWTHIQRWLSVDAGRVLSQCKVRVTQITLQDINLPPTIMYEVMLYLEPHDKECACITTPFKSGPLELRCGMLEMAVFEWSNQDFPQIEMGSVGDNQTHTLQTSTLYQHTLGQPLSGIKVLDLTLSRLHGLGTALRSLSSMCSLRLCNNRLRDLRGKSRHLHMAPLSMFELSVSVPLPYSSCIRIHRWPPLYIYGYSTSEGSVWPHPQGNPIMYRLLL